MISLFPYHLLLCLSSPPPLLNCRLLKDSVPLFLSSSVSFHCALACSLSLFVSHTLMFFIWRDAFPYTSALSCYNPLYPGSASFRAHLGSFYSLHLHFSHPGSKHSKPFHLRASVKTAPYACKRVFLCTRLNGVSTKFWPYLKIGSL